MIGVVFEGGGAKGSYHIGAYKALLKMGYKINGVTGTSIGALNAALITQGDFNKMEKIWLNVNISTLLDIDSEMHSKLSKWNLSSKEIKYFFDLSIKFLKDKGFSTEKIRNWLSNNIDEDKIRKSKMDFGLSTVSLTDVKSLELFKEDIPEGKMVDYLMASCYFPGFKMQRLDNKYFVDGGLSNNLPINMLINKGYKKIFAIRTNGLGRVRSLNKKDIRDTEIIYINPDDFLGRTFDFEHEQCKYNINLGYFDTMKILKNLDGNMFYIRKFNGNFEKYILRRISQRQIIKIGYILGFKNIPYKQMLFDKILPKLKYIYSIDKSASNSEVFLRIFEEIAYNHLSIEQFKIYGYRRFVRRVLVEYRYNNLEYKKELSSFSKKIDFISKAYKKDITIEIMNILSSKY